MKIDEIIESLNIFFKDKKDINIDLEELAMAFYEEPNSKEQLIEELNYYCQA